MVRDQQSIALVNMIVQANSRLIQYNIGFCPGFILGSYLPGTLKSTTVLLGLLAGGGDPALFLEAGSSTEAVELLQTLSTFCVLLDDSKETKKIQKVIVGGFQVCLSLLLILQLLLPQTALKALVGRGSKEKIGGFGSTQNWTGTAWEERIIDGRMLLQDMEKSEGLVPSYILHSSSSILHSPSRIHEWGHKANIQSKPSSSRGHGDHSPSSRNNLLHCWEALLQ